MIDTLKLKTMLEAGIEVKFCSLTHVQAFPRESHRWWPASSLETSYDLGVKYGFLPKYVAASPKHTDENRRFMKELKATLKEVAEGKTSVEAAAEQILIDSVVSESIHEEIRFPSKTNVTPDTSEGVEPDASN